MRLSFIAIFFLFYALTLLENSFFSHFAFFQVVPDLVFIFFFLLVFFEEREPYVSIIFYALCAGFFTDIASFRPVLVSPVLFLLLGWLIKRVQHSLQERDTRHPVSYFFILFLVSSVLHIFLFTLAGSSGEFGRVLMGVWSWKTALQVLYNGALAFLAFHVYKKIQSKKIWSRY